MKTINAEVKMKIAKIEDKNGTTVYLADFGNLERYGKCKVTIVEMTEAEYENTPAILVEKG